MAKNDFFEKINELKQNKNLEIISYYNTIPDIQAVSDCVGAFRKLYEHCRKTNKNIFFYCGPDYIVNLLYSLLPSKIFFKSMENAECNLNDYISQIEFKELMRLFPLAKVAAYYKSNFRILISAHIVFDDTCVLSAIKSIDSKQIIVTPDYNVACYAQAALGDEQEIIAPHGFCQPLYSVEASDINQIRMKHPEAVLIVHPECNYHLHEKASQILGYDQAYDYFAQCENGKSFILGYNSNFIGKIKRDFPGLTFYKPNSNLKCNIVQTITPEYLLTQLDKLNYKVEIPEDYKEIIERKVRIMLKLKDEIKK